MKGYVYFLKSLNKRRWIYVGSTINLNKRLKEHNAGKCKSTKGHRPLKLLYLEEFDSIERARKREKYFKTGIGFEEKTKILHNLK